MPTSNHSKQILIGNLKNSHVCARHFFWHFQIAHERQGSLALVTLQGNMADVEEAPEEQNFHQENDAEDQMDVDQEPELDK